MDTLGVVESRSIAAGAELADGMVKVADVELVRAATICGGRYLIHVAGDRQAVSTAVDHARNSGRALHGSFVISNISPQVTAVLRKAEKADAGDALGVVEARSVSSGIAAADAAVKRADIRLLRLVCGQGINGKSYFVFGGDSAAVEEAAQASKDALGKNLVEAVVILRPDVSVVKALTSGVR
ncbi:MAG: BMC domain-containing protein [Desulfovibrio sp.]|uniref:BMC domain-containing protein n=1 Tax=Desulfovibrio sp. 7SRBS1 TaxID=3378064 RepID=UPI003B3FD455